MNENPQYTRETCYFCHETDTHILETHHIVPVRHGGADDPENLVRVCPTCHERLERLYDGRFYDTLGVETTEPDADSDDGVDAVIINQSDCGSEIRTLVDVIAELEDDHAEGVPISKLRKRALAEGMTESQFDSEIRRLKQSGDVYEPRTDHFNVTS
jgi:hypothetical protein